MSAAGLITGGYITDVLSPETLMEMYRFSSPYPPEIWRSFHLGKAPGHKTLVGSAFFLTNPYRAV